jgi:hypothetical protein
MLGEYPLKGAKTLIYFAAQLVASLIERELRRTMKDAEIEKLPLLPEGRLTATPTVSHIFDRFEDRHRHYLVDGEKPLKTFAEPLTHEQLQVLTLLSLPASKFR